VLLTGVVRLQALPEVVLCLAPGPELEQGAAAVTHTHHQGRAGRPPRVTRVPCMCSSSCVCLCDEPGAVWWTKLEGMRCGWISGTEHLGDGSAQMDGWRRMHAAPTATATTTHAVSQHNCANPMPPEPGECRAAITCPGVSTLNFVIRTGVT
jgi:hypothetical protein